MKRTFAEAMAHRRSYYSIGSDSSVLDEEIVHIIREAVKNVPSAFNSQSTRIVLLLGDEHKKLWNIVKETLKARISAEAFAKTEAKIDGCFASGHGTVLYFEDTSVVKNCRKHSLPIRIISLLGRSIPPPCTSLPSGLCWKIWGWEPPCNTITP